MNTYHRTLSITFILSFFALLGSSAYAKRSISNSRNTTQLELNTETVSSNTSLALSIKSIQSPISSLNLDIFSKESTLKDLSQAYPESSLIPTFLSLFTHSSYNSLQAFGSPKVVIRSFSPVNMTFTFTFNFGET